MDQYETLFEVGERAWRLELRFKVGGGPFDPAGYSIAVTRPSGALAAMEVHKAPSQARPMAHLEALMKHACERIPYLLADEIRQEARSPHTSSD